jgi:hypothetical protein
MRISLPQTASAGRIMLRWFALSLFLRTAFALMLRTQEAIPIYDEKLYLGSAKAWAALFELLWRGGPISSEILTGAYGGGVWPPLHSMILSLPLCFGLPDTFCIVPMLLLNAATTPLVWLFARAIVPPKAAIAAACLHLLCPFWLNFAHLLLSENAFLFFLCGALAALVRIHKPGQPASLRRTALAGLLLGCAGLCRATVIPLVPVFLLVAAIPRRSVAERACAPGDSEPGQPPSTPVDNVDGVGLLGVDGGRPGSTGVGGGGMIAVDRGRPGSTAVGQTHMRSSLCRRAGASLAKGFLLLLAFALVIAPWQYWLWRNESPHTPLLSTSAGYNLLLGNNRYIPAGYGSAWFLPEAWLVRRDLHRAAFGDQPVTRPQRKPGYTLFSNDQPARQLALASMKETPARLRFERAWRRLFFTFGPDLFLPRHLLHGNYPPRSFGFIAGLTLLDWLFGLGLFLLCAIGPFRPQALLRWRWLLPLAAAAAASPTLVSVGFSRLAQPSLLIMLPLAGAALLKSRRQPSTPVDDPQPPSMVVDNPQPPSTVVDGRRPGLTGSAQTLTRPARNPAYTLFLAVLALAATAIFLQPLPQIFESHLKPCAIYLRQIAPLSHALGVKTTACDVLAFRNDTGHPLLMKLTCQTPDSRFIAYGRPPQTQIVLRIDPGRDLPENPSPVIATTAPAAEPLRIEAALLTPAGDIRRRATFAPWNGREAWRTWRESGLPGVQFRWEGGGLLQP